MSDVSNDPDLEARVRRALHSIADAHQPSSSVPMGAQPADSAPRRSWLIAAATLLVAGGVVAVFAVVGRGTSTSPVVTAPVVTPPSEPSDFPGAGGDGAAGAVILEAAALHQPALGEEG